MWCNWLNSIMWAGPGRPSPGPGGLVHVLGDAHIYETHVDAVQAQLTRTPTDPPHLCIFDEDHALTTWEAFTLDAFVLTGYVPQAAIRAPMVA